MLIHYSPSSTLRLFLVVSKIILDFDRLSEWFLSPFQLLELHLHKLRKFFLDNRRQLFSDVVLHVYESLVDNFIIGLHLSQGCRHFFAVLLVHPHWVISLLRESDRLYFAILVNQMCSLLFPRTICRPKFPDYRPKAHLARVWNLLSMSSISLLLSLRSAFFFEPFLDFDFYFDSSSCSRIMVYII